jgi:hypothetical protein
VAQQRHGESTIGTSTTAGSVCKSESIFPAPKVVVT